MLKSKSQIVHFPLVIGRGGEHINKIQRDSGCKVQIAHGEHHNEHIHNFLYSSTVFVYFFGHISVFISDSAGLSDRNVSLTGSPDAIK